MGYAKSAFERMIYWNLLIYPLQVRGLTTEVLSIYPQMAPNGLVSGTDPITMIFKDAVVPLDADYSTTDELVFTAGDSLSGTVRPHWASHTPFWFNIQESGEIRGSIRWVTTYIARFIILDTYNSDLSFTVETNPFFDGGIDVDVEELNEMSSYTTSSLTISSSVYSKATEECGGISGLFQEVQPDGVIKLSSSVEVLKEFWESSRVTDGFTLQLGLCIDEGNGWSSDRQGWLSAELESHHDTVCLTVFDVASELDSTFFIYFDQGAVYNEKAGLLKGGIILGFSTLRSFTLDQMDNLHRSSKLNFKVDHGIGDKETFQAKLESSLTISPNREDPVPFTVRVDNCSFTLEIIGIAVDTTYSIAFPDVEDYWGLRLETSEIVFTTDSVPSGYEYPTTTLTYLPDENLTIGWPLFALKAPELKEGHTYALDAFKVWPIGVRDFVTKVVGATSNTWTTVSSVSSETYMEHVYSASLPAGDMEEWDVLKVELDPSPGLYLIWLDLPEENWYEKDRVIVIQQTDLNVVMVDDSEGGFLVWVTSFTSDEVVQGAVVSLYQEHKNSIQVIAEGVTDNDGLAYIQGDNIEYSVYSHLLVEHDEQYALVLNTWTSKKYFTQSKAVLTTDRSLYDIGETVNVYVILRVLEEDSRWVIPDSEDLSYYLAVSWNSALEMETYPITLDTNFGTAMAALQIPNDKLAYNGETSIILRKESGGYLASTTVMVASPRIPTSSLSVEALTTNVNLNGDAELQLQAVLLTDTKKPIQGSEVAFFLTTTDSTLNEHNELRSVSTDETGSALLSEKIDDIFPGIEAGQSISWRVEVTGPTGELLLEEGIIEVELSDWKIEISLSFADFIIPGWPVQATIKMEGPSSSQPDQIQPTMVLYNESCDEDSLVDEINCNGYECLFDLPETANPFHVQASFVDPLGTKVTTECVKITDWSADDWEIRRINELPGPQVVLDKDVYEIGDSVVIKYFNSLPNARALFRWGSTISKRVEITDVLSRGIQTKTITLGDECTDSCKLVVALASAKQDDVASKSPDFVKFSLLYKEHMPKFVSDIVSINVNAAKSMEISITADATEVQPGETIGITINADPYSQVLIMAIDQSYLEISPHSLPPLAEDYELDLKTDFGVTGLQNSISSIDVIEEAWEKFKRMRIVNPFLSPCWKFHSIEDYSNTKVAFIDQSDEMFMEYYSCEYWTGNDQLLPAAVYYDSIFKSYEMTTEIVPLSTTFDLKVDNEVSSAYQEGTSDGPAVAYIRSNFDPNPLFEIVETNSDGKATISFELPDDIATFEVRALAVKNDVFGLAEAVEVISQKPVSMQALQPLFVREEDQFDAGVTIALSNDNSMSVLVTRGEDESQGVELVGTTPVPVIFNTGDLESGDHVEQYVLSSVGGEQLDGLQTILTVRDYMDPVNVGSSMALREGGGDVWTEVISFPEGTSPVNLRIIAGNGFKASVQVLAEKFGSINEDWITGSEALAIVTVNKLLELNGQEDIQYSEAIFLEKLNQLTTSEYGLRWSSSSTSISLWLNLNAVYFAFYRNDDTISHLVPFWETAAENQMLSDIADMIQRNKSYDEWTMIALAHLAFGRDWVPPHEYLTRSRLLSNIEYSSVEAKAYFCMAFYLDPVEGIEETIASNILDELSDTIRVQGQTAYLTISGSTEPLSRTFHGLIVSASALRAKRKGVQETDNILQKLAVHVSEGSSSCWYWNIFDDLHSIIALIHYDELVGSTEGTPMLTIVEASSTIFEETVSSESPSIVSEWVWEEVWGEELELELDFTVQGEGEVRVAISTLYIPALTDVPLSRGLVVNRVIRAYDRITLSGYGPHLQSFLSGELYLVKVEVTTPDVVRDVFLDDYLPGGLEPLDPSLYDLSGSSPSNWFYFSTHWCWWCWTQTFDSDATFMADRVRWYATRLSAGTHEVSYIALANIPGIYNHPPASTWVSEQPEVMGMSAGQISVVQSSSSEYELLDEQISEFKAVLTGCIRALSADEICDMMTGEIISMWKVLSGDSGNDIGTGTAATLVRKELGDWLWYIIGIALAVILFVFGYLNRSRCISNPEQEGVCTPRERVRLDCTNEKEGAGLIEVDTKGKICD